MGKCVERLYNGIVKENPTFVLMLGMCPTLAVTTSAVNGIGMGLSTSFVLIFANLIISALRNIIPDRVRIPAFIVIVASLVTVVQLLIQGFVPSLYTALGIYIPLIVVNCIILGRAESYASKNDVISSIFDGIGMGIGFTIALTCIGVVREFLGAGAIMGSSRISVLSVLLIVAGIVVIVFFKMMVPGGIAIIAGLILNLTSVPAFLGSFVIPDDFHINVFILAPGAFFVLAVLTALQNKFKAPSATNGSAPGPSSMVCGGDCMHCMGASCTVNHLKIAEQVAEEAQKAAAAKKAAAEKALAAKKAAEAAKEAVEAPSQPAAASTENKETEK